MRTTDVVVIGAGQAGLSAAYHLRRRGLEFVILDAEGGPGGAWRHRWDSLTMATVNGIRELPGMPEVDADAAAPANRAVPAYFADFEERFEIPVERPVRVTLVEDDPAAVGAAELPADPAVDPSPTPLLVHSVGPDGARRAPIRTRAVLSATGTWTRPFVPALPGAASFRGRQLHTVEYVRAEDFAGQRVAVVGGGISALGFLQEIAAVGETFWYTRREPVFEEGEFTEEAGRQVIAGVIDQVRQGLPVGSVVSNTGLRWTPALREAERRGILRRRPMFERITEAGVVEADGTVTELDAILWATGFRHELRHLRTLGLRGELGGIALDGTAAEEDPRIHLLGYGPSASTIGANRAGRAAVTALLRTFERESVPA
ncbi:FAD-dependent oxidoreductase [Brachybacterium fresconis]|uniref:Cation diffusion facilitator CzcD-associated flavoprotein CzcO n=1 Tax=Brachybacterium fresconis TaxID=173363 RepID=A0ABS4YFY9_9MICO|nr:cation diffusion facilitator CzcD-associated flavoprotein CzcO [Brachybacterium fresconis]